METLIDSHLKSFLKRPTLIKAKQAFVAYREKGLPVPEDIALFLTEEFRKDIINRPNKSQMDHPNIDRSVLVELMIRIAKSKNGESIDSLCQMVAEESGIQGNETNTAGELLRKGMEEFRGRSKVKRSQ
jgi:hypothetical protein